MIDEVMEEEDLLEWGKVLKATIIKERIRDYNLEYMSAHDFWEDERKGALWFWIGPRRLQRYKIYVAVDNNNLHVIRLVQAHRNYLFVIKHHDNVDDDHLIDVVINLYKSVAEQFSDGGVPEQRSSEGRFGTVGTPRKEGYHQNERSTPASTSTY